MTDNDLAGFMTAIITMGVTVISLGGMWFRHLERRHRRGRPELPNSDERLERIEQAVETMAVEVERLAEGQRFSARLLAELSERGERAALPQRSIPSDR